MIDTHCHIDFPEYDKDRDQVIKRAKNTLDAVVLSGTNYEANIGALKYAKEEKGFIYPSLGFHPVTSQNATIEERKISAKTYNRKQKKHICNRRSRNGLFFCKR